MNYNETMEYINAFEVFGSRLGLTNITRLTRLLGNPQESFKTVHVAGTNGKGSVCAFIGAILTASGYKTGVFTSPHIERFSERIVIDGVEISEEEIVSVCGEVGKKAEILRGEGSCPTHFEVVTALALSYFREKKCDFVVLEVGLGGRLDATNVISAPEAAVITSIDYDHTDVLGNTLEEIAFEKAGIIKECDVITPFAQPEVMRVFESVCAERGARLHTVTGAHDGLKISLLGEHQLMNAALAIRTAEILREKGCNIPETAVTEGLLSAKRPGRFEILRENPPVVIDGAHNPHGVRALVEALKKYFGGKKILFVAGVLADKDYMGMMAAAAPLAREFLTVTPDSSRALPAKKLAAEIRNLCLPAESFETVEEAVSEALSRIGENEAVCCFGSLHFIGKVRTFLGSENI